MPNHGRNATILSAILGLTTLAGCAPPGPPSPTVLALPAQGENFALFQQHDETCRQYAAAQVGGQSPGQAAAKSGIAGAAVGTGLGAAVGALLGSVSGHAGAGAAIGAGGGLLAGSLVGAENGQESAASVQGHYDRAYTQCMVANGEKIAPPTPAVVYAAPTPVYVPAPVAVYRPAPVYVVPPGVVAVPVAP